MVAQQIAAQPRSQMARLFTARPARNPVRALDQYGSRQGLRTHFRQAYETLGEFRRNSGKPVRNCQPLNWALAFVAGLTRVRFFSHTQKPGDSSYPQIKSEQKLALPQVKRLQIRLPATSKGPDATASAPSKFEA